jgi:hypothetical protein
MWEVYKNDTITPYEDAGGVTNTAREGELRLGNDFFTGESLAEENEVLSRRLVCDRCGCPPRDGKTLIKQAGFMLCERCLDDDS